MNTKSIRLDDALHYINELDLGYIVDVMCAENYSLARWTLSDAEYCCQLYKNFLYLQKKYSSEALVPSREIDEFWHNHILYTRNYFHDCLNIFGHYLHHNPSSPKEDPEQLAKDYLKTKKLYFDEFKKPLKLIEKQV